MAEGLSEKEKTLHLRRIIQMNKGLIGFVLGLIAVLGGAFVATVLLKNKLTKKYDDEDDFDDFDSFDDPVDDEEFEHFFANDEMPEVNSYDSAEADEDSEDEEEKEEQL